MRQRVLSIGAIALLSVCLPLWADDAAIKVERDLVYGKGDDNDLKLDLARPAQGDGPFPAVVCLHGGGWRGGKRKDLDGLIHLLARKNFVAVTVTYRFTPKYPFPAQIEDSKAAVRLAACPCRQVSRQQGQDRRSRLLGGGAPGLYARNGRCGRGAGRQGR